MTPPGMPSSVPPASPAPPTARDTAVELAGVPLRLCPERAAWWCDDPAAPRGGVVLIADPHLGKADLFRRHGIPVPHAAAEADLRCLSALIERTGSQRLVVLGDLLHSRPEAADATASAFAAWRRRHGNLEITLVRGNHDRCAGPVPAEWAVAALEEPAVLPGLPLVLRHHPTTDPRGPVVCGHVHPAVTLRGATPEASVRLPCFHWRGGGSDEDGGESGGKGGGKGGVERGAGSGRLILPAFGGFTGTHRVEFEAGDRCFAVTESSVPELLPEMWGGGRSKRGGRGARR